MRHATTTALVCLLANLATAAPPEVKFPVGPVVTPPAPPPSPSSAVATVTTDRLFVIESKEPVTIIGSPAGLVKVNREVGPLTVYAKFADGTDKPEKRTFTGPHVFLLEPVKAGEVELLVIPEKVTSEADILRRQVRVETGEAPKPTDPSPFPESGVRVLIVYEKDELASLSPSQVGVLTSGKIREYLNAKCVTGVDGKTKEWRIVDKDVKTVGESATWKNALARPRQSVPWILIGDGKTGYEGPLPKTEDETLTLLKKFGG